ncbi:Grx4 family monothiol glutaredoxin [Candidatus Bandiella euplotis]|uniref:Glutaredoxin n=1 Tax=Candidatus Bandiella euplotis TaxID=1664265 RepID=A0ABZ0UL29_9RICK|nr:Grx4 family monothiol glutaredoxin [Candidatus Bandiella woodruffii]WPX96850.1 Glutaredoxin-4 [Candidatus Bandiella woodruffii]
MNNNLHEAITQVLNEHEVVLFMKGTPEAPACGFSATVVNILNILKVKFVGINILEDDDLRQAIKDYSDWPTIPQLYIKAQFIGGCDIVREMYESGELQQLI